MNTEEQLTEIVSDYEKMRRSSKYPDLSDYHEHEVSALVMRAISAISRASGQNSSFARQVDRVIKNNEVVWFHIHSVLGITKALLSDVKNGYLTSFAELVHADISSDYLEQAQELLSAGYKDASAVMIGAILEQNLKSLADKHGIDFHKPDGTSKKTDTINSELAGASVYNKREQKNVTALLGLRNDAAHGEYGKYDKHKIELMLASVRLFVQTYPS